MKKILVAAVFTLVCINARADGEYVGVSYGQAKVSISAIPVTAPDRFSKDDTGETYKIFGGRNINEYLAVEGGLQQFKGADTTVILVGVGTARITYEVEEFFVDVVGKYPVLDSFTIFGKVGLARTQIRVRPGLTCISNCNDEAHGEFDYRYGVGAQYKFTDTDAVRLDLERTANVGDSATTGESNLDYVGFTFVHEF